MNGSPDTIPGCANYDIFSRACSAACWKNEARVPTLARVAQIDSPGVIAGPPAHQIEGIVCTVSNGSAEQAICNEFVVRTQADDERDSNI